MYIMRNILTFSLFFTLLGISLSGAEIGLKTPSFDGIQSAGPYYNPASKSYFELFKMRLASQHNTWKNAYANAQKKYFKNTAGRLAIIKGLATHQFIVRHFKGRNIWIGLQYLCVSQSLKWVDDTYNTETGFSVWDNQWAWNETRCGDAGYMGVYYTNDNTTAQSPRWRAVGSHKDFVLYLVEYPTGKE